MVEEKRWQRITRGIVVAIRIIVDGVLLVAAVKYIFGL